MAAQVKRMLPGCLIIGWVQVQWTQESYVSWLRRQRKQTLPLLFYSQCDHQTQEQSFFGYEHPWGHWRHKGADCSLAKCRRKSLCADLALRQRSRSCSPSFCSRAPLGHIGNISGRGKEPYPRAHLSSAWRTVVAASRKCPSKALKESPFSCLARTPWGVSWGAGAPKLRAETAKFPSKRRFTSSSVRGVEGCGASATSPLPLMQAACISQSTPPCMCGNGGDSRVKQSPGQAMRTLMAQQN